MSDNLFWEQVYKNLLAVYPSDQLPMQIVLEILDDNKSELENLAAFHCNSLQQTQKMTLQILPNILSFSSQTSEFLIHELAHWNLLKNHTKISPWLEESIAIAYQIFFSPSAYSLEIEDYLVNDIENSLFTLMNSSGERSYGQQGLFALFLINELKLSSDNMHALLLKGKNSNADYIESLFVGRSYSEVLTKFHMKKYINNKVEGKDEYDYLIYNTRKHPTILRRSTLPSAGQAFFITTDLAKQVLSKHTHIELYVLPTTKYSVPRARKYELGGVVKSSEGILAISNKL